VNATADSTLANPEQRIADLQRANEELRRKLDERTTERDAALARETATAEVLGVINSSPGDLVPVFDAILEKALALSEASYGGISTYDGERFHVMARRGATPEYLDFIRTYTAPPLSPNSGLGRIARGERIVHIVDMADDDIYRAGDPLRVATVDLLGGRTCVWVALHKEGRLLGMLNVYRRQVRPFTDKQIALLQNFAAQAALCATLNAATGRRRPLSSRFPRSSSLAIAPTASAMRLLTRICPSLASAQSRAARLQTVPMAV
jgi:transcriptional regulator with GAF, ATPase, and Fis domain